MPFRQLFTVLLALIVIVLAAILVLSWGDDEGSDTVDPTETTLPADDAGTTSTSSTTSVAPVTTSIPFDCGTDPETGESTTTTAPAETTTTVATTTTIEGEPPTTEPPVAVAPTLGRNSSLSTVGLDTVTFGLTVTQAEQASGHEMINCEAASDCYRVTPDAAPTGISFVVDNGTIERVDIVGDSPITTLSGAGIGTTDEELDELFADQLERVDLGGGRTDVIFVPSDENDQEFRVAFTTLDGVVETLRSGRVPLVLEAEPCA